MKHCIFTVARNYFYDRIMFNMNPSIKNINILLIEDDLTSASLISSLLENGKHQYKYNIFHSPNLENVHITVHKHNIKVILLDLNLGEINGIDTYKKIVNLFKTIPIIIITGMVDPVLESQIMQLGAQEFIGKQEINSYNLSKSIAHSIERQNIKNGLLALNECKLKTIKPKILVVDDSKENLISIRYLLRCLNAEVFIAESGNEGLALLLQNEFAVILLDVNMPVMNGFEAANLIRSNDTTKKTPIIFMSAVYHDDIYLNRGYDSGAVDYLFKPINSKILISKIDVFLELYIAHKRSNIELMFSLKNAKRNLERKNKRLSFLVNKDPLTGLSNRKSFEAELKVEIAASKRHKRNFALIRLDINNFSWVNDEFGQACGDKLLKHIGNIIVKLTRPEDFYGRTGGDEFSIVLSTIRTPTDAGLFYERLLLKFKEGFVFNDKKIDFSVYAGISVYPGFTDSYDEIIKQADIAKNKAKQDSSVSFRFYSVESDEVYLRNNKIRHSIKNAVNDDSLRVLFQPIVDIFMDKIVGVEALLRWKHPELGNVSPADFIPIAEETKAIYEIGFWVMEQSFMHLVKCRERGISDIFYSINLSPIQLNNRNFEKAFNETVKKYDLKNANICFELTESVLGSYLEKLNINKFDFLKTNSFKLSIDDFGTGHSSLDRLASLPVSTLKIDGSFIRNINHSEKENNIVTSIIALSNALKLKTIAECVETEEQLNFLKMNNCRLVQGYYYYKPMPGDELLKILT